MGASINLIPYFVFKKLGITNLEPTDISFHLADRLVVYPRGAIKDVLVKVDKFIFSADFFVYPHLLPTVSLSLLMDLMH